MSELLRTRMSSADQKVDATARLSFIIPARNEEALIGEVLEAILVSIARSCGVRRDELWLPDTAVEVIVADDGSEDATPDIVRTFVDKVGVRLLPSFGRTCAASRNVGVAASSGRVLCFIDADTVVPPNAVERILQHHEDEGRCLVLYRLVSREPGFAPGCGGRSGGWRGNFRSRERSRCRRL